MIELTSADAMKEALRSVGYIASDSVAMVCYLAQKLGKPILCEGPAGVGKTELGKALAEALGRPLFRLQCYEGLDESKTLYEWKYAKQLLYAQLLRDRVNELTAPSADLDEAAAAIASHEDVFFSERFIDARPVLAALRSVPPGLLLIDEIDRSEDELEAFFLEVLGEFQVSIPEIGTVRAEEPPLVVLTSNATRELSDALRRRCLFLPMDFPDLELEIEILRTRVPDLDQSLSRAIASFVAELRVLDLKKQPSISETIDWAKALLQLGASSLDRETVDSTLSLLLKYRGDLEQARSASAEL